MKKTTVNYNTLVIVMAVFCLFPISSAFPQDEGLSETSRAAQLSQALKVVEESTKKHSEALADLLDKAPQEARPSIEHAIAVSKRGRNIAVEAVELAQTSSPLEKALLHTAHAERRVANIQSMQSKGKPEFVETLAKDYENAIGGALEDIVEARAQGIDVIEALNAVERSTKKHTEVLTGLLGEVPEQAKPAIAHAIEVSNRGRNHSLDVLSKIQRGELPTGKPESIGRPEGVGKPEKEHGRPAGRGENREVEREQKRDEPQGTVENREKERGRPEDKPGHSRGRGRR